MHFFRLIKIIWTVLRFGLDEFVFANKRLGWVRLLLKPFRFWRSFQDPRGIRLRMALESLGPIFVKFGQVISTRRDLLPEDIANELSLLQDQVPPVMYKEIEPILFEAYDEDINNIFRVFNPSAEASASVAQVHFGELIDGRKVAIKILRPGIQKVINKDIRLLNTAAWLIEKILPDGKRLRPREVVNEFERHLFDELDLLREAANASELGRNFPESNLLDIPDVYWDFCRTQVMVMERMAGTPVSKISELKEKGIDLKKLASSGVEIFFTQVFRDGFFHADMHPGNILVGSDGKYIALDFGIMGTLGETDKQYLARNFIAFFRRDYRDVAQAHVDAGWVPADTRVEEFESAIRAVCEPIFDRPLKEISFGKLLLKLFRTARRFNVLIQPQLVLLQKTLLNIEGLGRELDPDLDLWKTAKPFLERWMSQQLGFRALLSNLGREAPGWGRILPKLPGLVYSVLERNKADLDSQEIRSLITQKRRLEKAVWMLWGGIFASLTISIYFYFRGFL